MPKLRSSARRSYASHVVDTLIAEELEQHNVATARVATWLSAKNVRFVAKQKIAAAHRDAQAVVIK